MKAIVVLAALLAVAQARSAHPGSHHQSRGHGEVEDPHMLMPHIGTDKVEECENMHVLKDNCAAVDRIQIGGTSIDLGAPTRIISGSTASRGQFPYQVAIYLNGRTFCAGSLISRRWVLTAAKCASGIVTFTVYLGASNLSASESGRIVISTTSKIVHSAFNTITQLDYDIALINLNQDVTLNSYINVVPLAPGGTTVATNATSRLSGWSSSSGENTQTGSLLKYKDMVIVPNTECAETYGIIGTSKLCAKFADGSSTCNTGVGSPLVDVQTGKQIGVLSYWHNRLCAEGAPIIFTRVSSYAGWISSNTGIVITRSLGRLALLR